MLSRSFESSTDEEDSVFHEVSEIRPAAPENSLQDDVERLLEIAGELFSAIERQIHRMEEELVRKFANKRRPSSRSV
jgi:NTP pyrophosphatase (non-canonical NTP hydrolase)